MNRSAQLQAHNESGHISQAGDSFLRQPLAKLLQRFMIGLEVVRHHQLLDLFRQNNFLGVVV
jgi:hypothetical protein